MKKLPCLPLLAFTGFDTSKFLKMNQTSVFISDWVMGFIPYAQFCPIPSPFIQCNLDIVKKLVSGQYFTIRTFFTIQMFVSKDDMGCRFTPNWKIQTNLVIFVSYKLHNRCEIRFYQIKQCRKQMFICYCVNKSWKCTNL